MSKSRFEPVVEWRVAVVYNFKGQKFPGEMRVLARTSTEAYKRALYDTAVMYERSGAEVVSIGWPVKK